MQKYFAALLLLLSLPIANPIQAFELEVNFHGLIDLRATVTDSLTSYTKGGYGKFGSDDGEELTLSHAGGQLTLAWDNGISAHIVTNAYNNNGDFKLGLTEGYLKYSGLPNASGYRWQTKLGVFYPKISLENNAYAWASKNTLNSSSLNTWIGEEVRVLGNEVTLTRLGRINNNSFDLSLSLSAFVNNDPSGSMLSWHGWTISNRQTLYYEKLQLPGFTARADGYDLSEQASSSDPFLDVDDRIGGHVRAEVKFHKKGAISAGYYNNNGKPYIVENGQYAWKTRFAHIELSWLLPKGILLTSQLLKGDTLMQNPEQMDVVNNDYTNGYIALSKRIKAHRITSLIERFNVKDNDSTVGDDNTERGKAFTLNYTYRLSKPWFLSTEFTWLDSYRPARSYTNDPINLTERQLSFSARYFY
ncbi:hypothetical protein ACPUVO_03750 [Pseudocolwellia sp. HL-MZ19]|uniref:hypothetical protein n=1 Tax=unclassified Pseudocolwellia TaxID=2848178 RepID=UPI003CEB7CBC